jgi:hypothetical protein
MSVVPLASRWNLEISHRIDAPWGLARLSSKQKLVDQDAFALNKTYNYDDRAGKDVDIYILDTGEQLFFTC